MKILWLCNTSANADEHFNKNLSSGGGWLKSLDRSIQDRVDLHVAFYDFVNTDSFKYLSSTYHPIKIGLGKKSLLLKLLINYDYDRHSTSDIVSIVNRVKPDLIHIHGSEYNFASIINKVNMPVLVSIQGILTVYEHKFFSGIEKEYISACNRFSRGYKQALFGGTYKSDLLNLIARSSRERSNLRPCQYIMGRTAWDRRVSSLLSPQGKYFVGNEILRDSFYSRVWSKQRQDQFTIFSITGNNFYKGFEAICHTLKLLRDARFNIEWRVAGVTENDPIVTVVKCKLGNLYPTTGLQLLGRLTADELVEQCLSADAYVMASHIENSPNNLCEAMILGLPCVGTFAGGTGSLLQDGVEGILVQDGDPWAMAGAIIELLNNYDLCVKYGVHARKRALVRHNKENIVANLIETYTQIIDGHRSLST